MEKKEESRDSPLQTEYQRRQQNEKTVTHNPNDILVDIDIRFAGLIIGKGGARIKDLRKKSGAMISVVDKDSNDLKTVRISGKPKAKELAKKLVYDIIGANDLEEDRQKLKDESEQSESSVFRCTFKRYLLLKEENEKLQKRMAALPVIFKDSYVEHPEVTMMTDQEVKDFRVSKNNIRIKYTYGDNENPIPKPVLKFSHVFEGYPEILEKIQEQNFETPSPIQCQAWPVILSGHDLIAIAQTGTDRTLAFLLPAFIHIDFQLTPRSERKGPSILIMAPTRELVLQIENEVKKYSCMGIRTITICGGANSGKRRKCLRNGVEIIIATPVRLNDYIDSGAIDLSDVSFLVLDETDRMLTLGFEHQIRNSLLKVRADRQTIMTSATWLSGVKRLAKSFTTNPIQVTIGSLDLTTVNKVKQNILIMEEEEKWLWLDDFLKNCTEDDKIIIFVNGKVTGSRILACLSIKGLAVKFVYGGRDQSDREKSSESLRNDQVNILIATNVASCDININDITVVINFDFIKNIEEYVHRVERTGRAAKAGLAITLMTRKERGKAKELVELIEKSGQYVPPELQETSARYEAKKEWDRAEGGDRPFMGGRGGGRGFSGNRRNNY